MSLDPPAASLPSESEGSGPIRLPTDPGSFVVSVGDVRERLGTLPSDSVDVTVTSPPYLDHKDYGAAGQIGSERTVAEYVDAMRTVLAELLRVAAPRGSCFVVIGDSYRRKSLQLIPHRVALTAAEVGWSVRNDLIWSKLDAAPERVTDRWRSVHEHVLFLVKSPQDYRFDLDAVRAPYSEVTLRRWGDGQAYGGTKATEEAGRNGQRFRRGRTFRLHPRGAIPADVIALATARSPLPHYATFPPALVALLLDATAPPGGLVLDPFVGTGTTGEVALGRGLRFVGIDINPDFAAIATERLSTAAARHAEARDGAAGDA